MGEAAARVLMPVHSRKLAVGMFMESKSPYVLIWDHLFDNQNSL
jgi:hypothetical protein